MSRWLMLSLATFVASLAASLGLWYFAFDHLPLQTPTHWGLDGKPDGFTPRDRVLPQLLLMPGFLAFWIVLTLALPWLSPKRYEVSAFLPTYHLVMALTALMLGYLHAVILAGYLGWFVDPGRWLMAGIGGFFAALGTLLARVKPNFWMGVRTPWTLASPIVWERTHRMAGRLFVLAGAITLVNALLDGPVLLALGLILSAAFVPVLYSLVIYKRLDRSGALEREPPG